MTRSVKQSAREQLRACAQRNDWDAAMQVELICGWVDLVSNPPVPFDVFLAQVESACNDLSGDIAEVSIGHAEGSRQPPAAEPPRPAVCW
jgi:hypothetical protein